jgi:hypothetical protein
MYVLHSAKRQYDGLCWDRLHNGGKFILDKEKGRKISPPALWSIAV